MSSAAAAQAELLKKIASHTVVDTKSQIFVILTFCVMVFYIIVGRVFTWLSPNLTDAQMFAYMGNAWLHGQLPYIGVWDLKPPGIFALNAAVFAFFPLSFRALAVIEGLFILGTAITIFYLLREWKVCRMGICLGIAIFSVITSYDLNNVTEVYLLWPVALSMFFFTKALREVGARWFFVAGVFTGIATVFKLTGFAVFLAQASYVLLWCIGFRKISFSLVTKAVLTNLVGAVIVWIPICLYFGYYGGFRELLDASFFYPFNYASVGDRSFSRYFGMARTFVSDLRVIFVFIAVAAWFILSEYKRVLKAPDGRLLDSAYTMATLWLLCDLFVAFYPNRSHAQYFFPLRLSTAVLSGLSFSLLFRNVAGGQAALARYPLFAVLVASLVFTHIDKVLSDVAHLVRYGHLLSHDTRFGHDQPSAADQIKEIAVFLGSIKAKNDTLFTWEFSPAIFTAVQMKSPVQVLDMELRKQFSGRLQQKFGDDILRQLKQRPPTFFMDKTADRNAMRKKDVLYDDFSRLIDNQYTMLKQFEVEKTTLKLYRLNQKEKS